MLGGSPSEAWLSGHLGMLVNEDNTGKSRIILSPVFEDGLCHALPLTASRTKRDWIKERSLANTSDARQKPSPQVRFAPHVAPQVAPHVALPQA